MIELSQLERDRLVDCVETLSRCGSCEAAEKSVCDILLGLQLVTKRPTSDQLIATNRFFSLGFAHGINHVIRRVLSLFPAYRRHLLMSLLWSTQGLADDWSISATLMQLDDLTPELLSFARLPGVSCSFKEDENTEWHDWDRALWQAPDAVTLLSKVVESPSDIALLRSEPIVEVGFDWLDWGTPPINPAPAPWADEIPLRSPLETVRHPFWGGMVATLDACTGDYEWQSLILRGDALRSVHRTLGNSQSILDSLWRSEFGLYPVDPLVITPTVLGDHSFPQPFRSEGRISSRFPWLKIALDQLHHAEIAVESEGSWRLTDQFRTQLMKDDEHMMAFEAVRQRSYRLARSATKFNLTSTNEVAAS
jgi:hypothetical protein